MGLSENSVPLNPMVLLIIIPIKWLFHWEYTQHFQTNPYDSDGCAGLRHVETHRNTNWGHHCVAAAPWCYRMPGQKRQWGWCMPRYRSLQKMVAYGYGSIPMKIPFLVGWTSINPSYFDVNYRGTRFWPIPIWHRISAYDEFKMGVSENWTCQHGSEPGRQDKT